MPEEAPAGKAEGGPLRCAHGPQGYLGNRPGRLSRRIRARRLRAFRGIAPGAPIRRPESLRPPREPQP